MPAVKKLPEATTLLESVRAGLTNQEIGAKYGTSGEAVRQALAKVGYRREPDRPNHGRYLPWKVRSDHVGDVLARRLRTYSKREQGRTLTDTEARLLAEWIAFMEGNNSLGVPLSVHYDRQDEDGFWLEPRQPGDRDFISPPA